MPTLRTPTLFAIVNCCWLAVLMIVFFGYWNDYILIPAFAELNVVGRLRDHDPIGGVVPAYVPWAGALGGVTISLIGCVRHNRSWDPSKNVWHALRPVLGAIAASIGFVILVLVLKAAAGTQFATDEIPTNPASQGLFFVIGFILGFREGLFLELVQKIAKTILTTGDQSPTYGIELDRHALEFGPVPVGQTASETVYVTQTDPPNAVKITFDSVQIDTGDQFTATMLTPDPATPLRRGIQVEFKPRSAGAAEAKLQIVVGRKLTEVKLKGSAT